MVSTNVAELPVIERPLILTIAERARLRPTQEVSFSASQKPVAAVKLTEKAIRRDAEGRISAFRYADRLGMAVKFFTNIAYDEQNNVVAFKDAKGFLWTKLSTTVYRNAGWACMDENGRCQTRKAVHLGDVSFTEDGLQAAGKDAGFLGVSSSNLARN